jgi:acyl dehydratase
MSSLTYAKAVAGVLPLPRSKTLPERTIEVPGVVPEREHLAAYDRVCGFRLRDELPATFPHVLAFPHALELMTGRSFPVPVIGAVHIRNRIVQHRPLTLGEPLDLTVRAEGLEETERGTQFDVVAEARAGGELAWRDVSTYLRRSGKSGGGRKDGAEPPPERARWQVDGRTGRRYAAVSGDSNPIHLHPLPAKLFGFKRPIAHGMWVKARCLAALEDRLPDAFEVDVAFKLPLFLGSTVVFGERGEEFAVHDASSGKPHLTGRVTAP